MADPRVKTIKIKTGVVKRLAKEKVMYEKEADLQKNRIQKYKDEGKNSIYDSLIGNVITIKMTTGNLCSVIAGLGRIFVAYQLRHVFIC